MKTGIQGTEIMIVTEEKTAKAVGSGLLPVLATPAMIALMEMTCFKSVEPFLNEGEGTVGTYIEIKHSAPTGQGEEVTCESLLTKVENRKLTFTVKVFDKNGLVGEGVHERFVINNEKFMSKVNQ